LPQEKPMATQRTVPGLIPGQRVPMSYEEYLAASDEDVHAEWVNGEVFPFMPPSDRHQDLAFWLAIAQLVAPQALRAALGADDQR
jgi:hypothetical protein